MQHDNSTNNPRGGEPRGQKRRRNRERKPRTMRWFRDITIGDEEARDFVVARFYISLDNERAPELYMIPMVREVVRNKEGKDIGVRPVYHGNIEMNAVPLQGFDSQRFWDAMVRMKAEMQRMQDEYRRNTAIDAVPLEPRPSLMADLNRLLNKTPEPEVAPEPEVVPEPEPQPQEPARPALDLARLLPDW